MTGGILGAFLLTLIVGNGFISTDRSVTRQMLGHDFLAFYTAGSFVRQHRAHELYNLDSVRDFEQSTAHTAGLEVGKSFGPWWNPPFYALLFEPLAGLPYPLALDIWRWTSVAAVLVAIGLLIWQVARSTKCRARFHHARADWRGETTPYIDGSSYSGSAARYAGLVPLLMLISMPFVQAISHGQNTFVSLLLLTITAILWRGERKLTAGLAAGLLFYKPQLGAVVAAAMVLDLGWTALAGLCITGSALLAITLIFLPGSMTDWVHQLPANVRWMQVDHAYLWERHVTLKAFWRLLLQGREAGEPWHITTLLTYTSLAVLAGGLGLAMLRLRNAAYTAQRPMYRDRLITATITAMPLLMPFYFDYDLLLLAVPVVLYAIERISQPQCTQPQDRWFTTAWAALYAWLYFNPAVALHTHVSGTVILLSCTAGISIRRAMREDTAVAEVIVLHPQPVALAA